MGLISRTADLYYTFRFLRILTTPWKEMDAYKLGIIDENGNVIKKRITADEKSAFTPFHRLVFNVKRLLNKIPLGKTRIASYAAALFLLKEHGVTEEEMLRALILSGFNPSGEVITESTDSWRPFPPEMRSKSIPRKQMPQIDSEHRGALTQFLRGREIKHRLEEVDPKWLRPTQNEYSPSKVEAAKNFSGKDRAILVASDGHIVDGHHQWMAALAHRPNEKIRVIRFDASINNLLPHVKEFPSATLEEWAVLNGQLLPGRYRVKNTLFIESTGDEIAPGAEIFVETPTESVGSILGVAIYPAVHCVSNQRVLVASEDLA